MNQVKIMKQNKIYFMLDNISHQKQVSISFKKCLIRDKLYNILYSMKYHSIYKNNITRLMKNFPVIL